MDDPSNKTPTSGPAGTSDGDVDGDGVPNWVEVLAGSSPADRGDVPDADMQRRVTEVVSCKLCHSATGLAGEGLTANPHNDLGKLLAKTIPRKSPRKPVTRDGLRAAAERTSILVRFSQIVRKRPAKSRATYWEKIRLIHAPVDPEDNPTPEVLNTHRRLINRQSRRATRDPHLGFDHARHRADGFLLDAEKLK